MDGVKVYLDDVEQALRGKKLVFLVGAPRSGTTWLQLLLSRSPLVATAQETDLFNIFLHPLTSEWNRFRQTGEAKSLTEVLSEQDMRTLLRSTSALVLARIAQSKPAASIVLEKTPNHVNCWREILDLWPDAHFIHIIRDPRSVVASLRYASKCWGPQWGSSRISVIAERWISDVNNGRQIASATRNYQEVAYQELLSDSAAVLLRLLGRLGVRSTLEECQGYVEECSLDNLKAGRLENAPFDVARISKFRFRLGKADSWRSELSKREIALVERMARRLMWELGIEPVTRSRLASIWASISHAVDDTRYKLVGWLRAQARGQH
jgi:hypothetical protein